ncbi:MAG: bifunctional hydroxymethylpyrimidine kinase/phosphomethylpyrimidine kinase [Oscillospiraceae bacterium]|nr:bifunctional hydroxymethylpyrimidine kinase/phosphomethylpyrimidine kinase [Oscillospiraceae bacterium]
MSIVVVGAVFVDVKGFPKDLYLPTGRNAGEIKFVHGGVGRNVVEDIANVELRPTFVSLVDNSAQGEEVLRKLRRHKVNTDYIRAVPSGMGMWLAVFDRTGDLAGSISQRPDLSGICDILDEKGDEIFKTADSVVIEVDIGKDIVKRTLDLAEKYGVPVYGVVANMGIASERRDLLQRLDCFVCNQAEAGILFVADYANVTPEELCDDLPARLESANIPAIIVTMGSRGAVYASRSGEVGYFPAEHVKVRDTTGAGDAFCAGVSIGLTYGKSMREAVEIGTRLAASVIKVSENVCPRFRPRELGLEIDVEEE